MRLGPQPTTSPYYDLSPQVMQESDLINRFGIPAVTINEDIVV